MHSTFNKTVIRLAGLALALALNSIGVGQEKGKGLPVNRWTKLPDPKGLGYEYSGLMFVPTRGQLLQWGAVRYDKPGRNDVCAFDAVTWRWVSDYPSEAKVGGAITGGGAGNALSFTGRGRMLPSGNPYPAAVLHGVCWDSKREVLVYTMAGLMASYDPKVKQWKDMNPKTVLDDKEYPGSPPVYGVSTCYDPVHDEIVMFPYFNAKNVDLRGATGQIGGHYGTLRYSYQDNIWRRVSGTFGTDEQKQARKAVSAVLARASAALDLVWLLRRKPDAAKVAKAVKALEAAAAEAKKMVIAGQARVAFAKVPDLFQTAATALALGKPDAALQAGRDALWILNEDVLDTALRVEPAPRNGTPLVYDPKNQAIVMFGGRNALLRADLDRQEQLKFSYALNDTWLYDCKTRQWRELTCKNRPPRQGRVHMAYDDSSGLVVLATFPPRYLPVKQQARTALYTLDVAKGEWSLRAEESLPALAGVESASMGLDPVHQLLVLASGQETWAMRLRLAGLPVKPAPAQESAPRIEPQQIVPDDPAWLAKLKDLPANTWVAAKPPRETPTRDWGNLAVDPVRGWVCYMGGGHATYQVNDVAVYAVGANRWVHAPGNHNDNFPPAGWEGSTLGYRGGPVAQHLRNLYVAFDGRVYRFVGTDYSRFHMFPDPRFVRFYDIDRGGVWREMPIARIANPDKAPDVCYGPQMIDPAGRVLDLQFIPVSNYDPNHRQCFFRSYDINRNALTIREVPRPFPNRNGESRAFCYVPDRDQVFWCESNKVRKTWVYDLKQNKFIDLDPKRRLPGLPAVAEYVAGQDAVLAGIGGKEQWVYSFKHNTWAPLELRGDGQAALGWQMPYGQMVWVAKYGVLVNYSATRGVSLMRPDFSKIDWLAK